MTPRNFRDRPSPLSSDALNQNLSDGEVREYIAYFKWADTNLRPQVAKQPQPDKAVTSQKPLQKTSGAAGGDVTSNKAAGK